MMESQLNNQMESTETKVEEWIEDDGTRVIRTEVTTRIKPSYNIVEIGSLTSFEREFLEKHNEYRERHRVPPLHMSRDVNIFVFQFFFLFLLPYIHYIYIHTFYRLIESICYAFVFTVV